MNWEEAVAAGKTSDSLTLCSEGWVRIQHPPSSSSPKSSNNNNLNDTTHEKDTYTRSYCFDYSEDDDDEKHIFSSVADFVDQYQYHHSSSDDDDVVDDDYGTIILEVDGRKYLHSPEMYEKMMLMLRDVERMECSNLTRTLGDLYLQDSLCRTAGTNNSLKILSPLLNRTRLIENESGGAPYNELLQYYRNFTINRLSNEWRMEQESSENIDIPYKASEKIILKVKKRMATKNVKPLAICCTDNLWYIDFITKGQWKHDLSPILKILYSIDNNSPSPTTLLRLSTSNCNARLENYSSFDALLVESIVPSLLDIYSTAGKDHNRNLSKLLKRLNDCLIHSRSFPGYKLSVYGSALSGLSTRNSDVDLSMDHSDTTSLNSTDEKDMKRHCYKVKNLLERHGFLDLIAVTRARVPVVKGLCNVTGLHFDICLNNQRAVHNSNFIREYCALDERVRHLIIFVKQWAKVNKICSAADGCLSSYSWTVLAITYLIQIGFIPNLQNVSQSEDTSFCSAVEALNLWTRSKDRDVCTPVLVRGFYEWLFQLFHSGYAACVSMRYLDFQRIKVNRECQQLETSVLLKTAFTRARIWRVSIEDPFETWNSDTVHDLGIHVEQNGRQDIVNAVDEMKYVISRLSDDKDKDMKLVASGHLLWVMGLSSDKRNKEKKNRNTNGKEKSADNQVSQVAQNRRKERKKQKATEKSKKKVFSMKDGREQGKKFSDAVEVEKEETANKVIAEKVEKRNEQGIGSSKKGNIPSESNERKKKTDGVKKYVNSGNHWTKEEDLLLSTMQHLSVKEQVKKLGRSKLAIQRRLDKIRGASKKK